MRFENEYVGLSIKEILGVELGFSRKAITALKKREDGILLNGAHATVRAVVAPGDILEINFEDVGGDTYSECDAPPIPPIIYEDGRMIALNKPSHMPTHQSHGHYGDTLADALFRYFGERGRPFVFRAVNRLDRNTSGAVLIAKDSVACARLSALMQSGGIRKKYLALLEGELPEESGIIDAPICRVSDSMILRKICAEGEGQAARTEYRVLGYSRARDLTLVEASPITGRTHQLRVHFAHLGAPILGDELYGSPSPLIDRHALHAYSLTVSGFEGDGEIHIYAPLPEDMAKIIEETFGKEFLDHGRES